MQLKSIDFCKALLKNEKLHLMLICKHSLEGRQGIQEPERQDIEIVRTQIAGEMRLGLYGGLAKGIGG